MSPKKSPGVSNSGVRRKGAGLIGVIIPFYIYPGSEWSALARAKTKYSSVPIVAVVNPANGPGTHQDPNYLSGIRLLRSAGVTMVGYVATNFADRSLNDVMDDILAYNSLYQVDGIFLDEMSNALGYETYYSALGNFAKLLGFGLTVGNPGALVPTSYLGTLDNIVIYERGGLPSLESLSTFGLGDRRDEFSFISYGVSSLNTAFVGSSSSFVSLLYITDRCMPSPYAALPSYFRSLLSTLSTVNSQVRSSIIPIA